MRSIVVWPHFGQVIADISINCMVSGAAIDKAFAQWLNHSIE
jgi:hypothetical protein